MANRSHAPRQADNATQRRLQQSRERLQREPARAQRHLQALEQALKERGRPEPLVVEGEWRPKAVGKRLGKIFGVMFPPVCGCRTSDELPRVRRGDQHLPGQMLGALPQHMWGRPLQRRAQERLATLWPPVQDMSPAPRRRWPWTWGGDDRLFKKAGQLGRVGTWWRGQEPRVRRGSDGRLLVVVIDEGTRVIPGDFTGRRPAPVGPGRPCRDKRPWWQVRLDRTGAAIQRRCRPRPPPLVGADRWVGDANGAGGQPSAWKLGGRGAAHRRLPPARRTPDNRSGAAAPG